MYEHKFVASRAVQPPRLLLRKTGRPPAKGTTAVLRECRRHGLIEHHLCHQGSGRYYYRCKRCSGEAVTRRHQKVRGILLEEAGGRCAVCGYDRCRVNLHFPHVDPATKAVEMNMKQGRSLAIYREEAKKCVLVCANCHGEIEAGITPCPPLLAST